MSDASREQRLESILHAYLQAADRGEAPDRQVILDAHPDLRDELADYFADASKLDKMAKSLRTASFGGEPGGKFGEPGGVSPRVVPATIRYFGDYELLEEIARGGMGVVYKAKQVSLNRIVAIKMILKGELASEADVRRFRQEAEAAANLDHPNIVPIYEVGRHEEQPPFQAASSVETPQHVVDREPPFGGDWHSQCHPAPNGVRRPALNPDVRMEPGLRVLSPSHQPLRRNFAELVPAYLETPASASPTRYVLRFLRTTLCCRD